VTVYSAIGNSDDKLSQREWSEFCREFTAEVQRNAWQVLGVWHSLPNARYQNLCACFKILPAGEATLRARLETLRAKHRQDSIAWTYGGREAFIEPSSATRLGRAD
jgi:hypothetical protein